VKALEGEGIEEAGALSKTQHAVDEPDVYELTERGKHLLLIADNAARRVAG
jgi:DNA-binding HxlR family transcriptional regulator